MSIKSIIESILYVSGEEGVEVSDLKKALEIPTDDIKNILKEMKEFYETSPDSGLALKVFGTRYHLLSKAENKEPMIKILGYKRKNPLSVSLMETLAIIAYNKQCTLAKVESIRGFNCTAPISKLIELGLIEQTGRAAGPGRAHQYEVTQKFFNLFGIKSLADLPKIKENQSESEDYDSLDFFDINRSED